MSSATAIITIAGQIIVSSPVWTSGIVSTIGAFSFFMFRVTGTSEDAA